MKEPCCVTCRAGPINFDCNGSYLFKNSLTCCCITSTASSTTAAPKYASEWWKRSTATSKPFFEGAAATRISPICCSRPSAWQSPRPNSSFSRKQPKMRSSTNSCAEPVFVNAGVPFAACVAVAVERIVALYKQVLEIRKLRGELQKQAVPEKITNDLEDHANKLITDEIPNMAAKIMAEFYRGENLERKTEVR